MIELDDYLASKTKTFFMKPKRVALAYSGGLDTSIIIPWLRENYQCEVLAVCGDIGQGDDGAEGAGGEGAYDGRFLEVHIADMSGEFVTEHLWRLVRSGGVYEHNISVGERRRARPLLAKKQVEVALATGCDGSWRMAASGRETTRFGLRAHV